MSHHRLKVIFIILLYVKYYFNHERLKVIFIFWVLQAIFQFGRLVLNIWEGLGIHFLDQKLQFIYIFIDINKFFFRGPWPPLVLE